MKYLLVLILVLLPGCLDVYNDYTVSSVGLLPYSRTYCNGGLVFNNEMENLYDSQDKPITCTGYIRLTSEEAKARGYNRS